MILFLIILLLQTFVESKTEKDSFLTIGFNAHIHENEIKEIISRKLGNQKGYSIEECLSCDGESDTDLVYYCKDEFKSIVTIRLDEDTSFDFVDERIGYFRNFSNEIKLNDICSWKEIPKQKEIKVKELFQMDHKITLYFPSLDKFKNKIPDIQKKLRKTIAHFSSSFGGATVIESIGYYLGEINLFEEKVYLIYSFTKDFDEKDFEGIINHCIGLKEELKQEMIAIEWNNVLYFV